jgi:hypothetical protein
MKMKRKVGDPCVKQVNTTTSSSLLCSAQRAERPNPPFAALWRKKRRVRKIERKEGKRSLRRR